MFRGSLTDSRGGGMVIFHTDTIIDESQVFATIPDFGLLYAAFEPFASRRDFSNFQFIIVDSDWHDCSTNSLNIVATHIVGCRVEGCKIDAEFNDDSLRKLSVWIPTKNDKPHSDLVKGQAICMTAALLAVRGQWGAWTRMEDSDFQFDPQSWQIKLGSPLWRCLQEELKTRKES